MGRAPCCEKVGLKKGRWTTEEDEILLKYIQAHGEGSWRSLPKNAGLLRCGKSCRLRWINYLRADLKRGNISAEEEDVIIKLHGTLGNRWSVIAGHLPGRTDNEIKNYWNSHLGRRIHIFKSPTDDGGPVIMDIGRISGRSKRRRGGRSNTSAGQKSSTNAEEERKTQQTAVHQEESPSTAIPVQREGREILVSGEMGPPECRTGGVLAPHERVESGIPCSVEGMGCGAAAASNEETQSCVVGANHKPECFFCPDDEIDSWLVGLSEEKDSEILGSNEERECWSADNHEEGENVPMGGNEDRTEGEGWYSSVAHGPDNVGCTQDEWLDWEWEEIGMLNGRGERWPSPLWLRDCDVEEPPSSSWLWDGDMEELLVGRKARVC